MDVFLAWPMMHAFGAKARIAIRNVSQTPCCVGTTDTGAEEHTNRLEDHGFETWDKCTAHLDLHKRPRRGHAK